jgi:ribosomal protein S18 acetylase RimI-like enzyme
VPAIRNARVEDAKALAQLAEATFRAAFGAMNAPANMDLHCRGNFAAPLQAAQIADPRGVTLLSEDEGVLIGYAQLRCSEAPACVPATRPGEIQRIYVVEEWHGEGVAQALMGACIEELKQRGCDAAWLGVWERNPRAIAFYRKLGFVAVGDHVFRLGEDPQRDVIMAKAITPD